MTAMQLNAQKMELIKMLIEVDDEKTLAGLMKVLRRSKADEFERIPGLAYTREERIASIREGLEDIRAGRTYTTEEVFKPCEQWL